jgi:hypothetical protein
MQQLYDDRLSVLSLNYRPLQEVLRPMFNDHDPRKRRSNEKEEPE